MSIGVRDEGVVVKSSKTPLIKPDKSLRSPSAPP